MPRPTAEVLAFIEANATTVTGDLGRDFRDACRNVASITGGSIDDAWKAYLESLGYSYKGPHSGTYKDLDELGGGGDPLFADVYLLLNADSGAGTPPVVDSSGNHPTWGYTGTGPVAIDTGTKYAAEALRMDWALQKDMTDVVVQEAGNDFTIEFWLKLDPANTASLGLFGMSFNLEGYIISGGGLGVRRVGTYTNTGFSGLNNGEWRHIAYVQDGANFRIYVDGTQVYTVAQQLTLGYAGTWFMFIAKTQAYNSNSYMVLEDFRVTLANCRYPDGTAFTPPTEAFPRS